VLVVKAQTLQVQLQIGVLHQIVQVLVVKAQAQVALAVNQAVLNFVVLLLVQVNLLSAQVHFQVQVSQVQLVAVQSALQVAVLVPQVPAQVREDCTVMLHAASINMKHVNHRVLVQV